MLVASYSSHFLHHRDTASVLIPERFVDSQQASRQPGSQAGRQVGNLHRIT